MPPFPLLGSGSADGPYQDNGPDLGQPLFPSPPAPPVHIAPQEWPEPINGGMGLHPDDSRLVFCWSCCSWDYGHNDCHFVQQSIERVRQILVDTQLGIKTSFTLSNLLQSIPDTLQQAWSSITNANASLLKVASTIETTELLLQSLFPLTSSWQGDQTHIHDIFEFIHSFRKLDVKAAWVELGQVWTNFSLKMETFTSGAAKLKSLPGFNRLF
jgi:hypothetical protein